MDYIREELLRQKRVLAALMSGGTPEAADAEDGLENVVSASQRADVDKQVERAISVSDEAEAISRLASVQRASDHAERSKTRHHLSDALQESEMFGISEGWSFGGAGERSPGYTVTYGNSKSGEAADVRAVSRTIQRDARRYDGGFSIY